MQYIAITELAIRRQYLTLIQIPGCAERLAARDDRHLDQRAGILEYPAHRGVARLVVSDHTLFLVGDDLILAFEGIGSLDRRCFQPLAYFLICTVCLAAILFEYH